MRQLTRLLFCAALWLSACVGTPVPQPPVLEEPDPAQLFNASTLEFWGGPGAVPEGDQLWIMPLDVPLDPVLAPVAPDGSFMSTLIVESGQEVRLQARSLDGRSRPIDIQAPIAAEVVRATEGCLLLEPERELLAPDTPVSESTEVVIQVSNTCGAEASFAIGLRRPDARWVINSATPVTIPDGGSETLRLTYRPDGVGLHEEILFLDVSSPEADRRVVTLSGTGL